MNEYTLEYRERGKVLYVPIYASDILQAKIAAEKILASTLSQIGWIITKSGKRFFV